MDFVTITVKLTIGPPGFEPGTARYRPPGGSLWLSPGWLSTAGRSRPLSYGPFICAYVYKETGI